MLYYFNNSLFILRSDKIKYGYISLYTTITRAVSLFFEVTNGVKFIYIHLGFILGTCCTFDSRLEKNICMAYRDSCSISGCMWELYIIMYEVQLPRNRKTVKQRFKKNHDNTCHIRKMILKKHGNVY